MKKSRILLSLLAALLLVLPVAPVFAQQPSPGPVPGVTYWWFQLRDERGQPVTAAGLCFVYTAGGDTLATIYTDQNLSTTATNPVTAAPLFQSTGNGCSFYTPSTTTSVDVVAWTKRARSRISGYTPAGSAAHVLVVDQQMTAKIIQVPMTAQAPSSGISYVNSGVTIPKGFVVRDVFYQITNVGAGNNVHFTAGILEKTRGGFCARGTSRAQDQPPGGVQMSPLGWTGCSPQITTAGLQAPQDYVIAGFHVGQLLGGGYPPGRGATATHAGFYI